ncbi:MAG: hypothetical protein PVH29_13290 [Candidatus Zixiibacteriota bacterium]|jgi:hypothetical protein
MRSIILGVVLLAASAAYGGVLYLELPPAYDAEMVEHPTDDDLTALRDFAREELGKLNNAHTCRVVIFTKDGTPVARRFDEGEGN